MQVEEGRRWIQDRSLVVSETERGERGLRDFKIDDSELATWPVLVHPFFKKITLLT